MSATNLRLLSSNQQEGNDPLDIGLNALDTVEKSKGGRGVKSELSISGFAKRLGKSQGFISQMSQAAQVYKLFTQVNSFGVAVLLPQSAVSQQSPALLRKPQSAGIWNCGGLQ